MKPFETLDTFATPDRQRLTLHRHDGDYYIHLDGHELMSTRVHGSEAALGKLACERLRGIRKPRVLIGGLGLGFTLVAALQALPRDAIVVQAEIFSVVVDWHRQHLQSLGVPLDDARVRVQIGDVAQMIRRHEGVPYDAILLDTDNGPHAMCVESNASLYDEAGIELVKGALHPGGVLAVWSAHADPAFVKRLRRGGFHVRSETVRGHGRKGPLHHLFLAEA
jgi:spermidine synthase